MVVDLVGLNGAVADSRQPDDAELAQRRHHVEDDARLARLVELEAVPRDHVEEVRVRQSAKERRLEMIRGDEMLLSPAGGDEERDVRIVGSSGQKLQGQKRVRRAAFAEVDFDRVRRPASR